MEGLTIWRGNSGKSQNKKKRQMALARFTGGAELGAAS